MGYQAINFDDIVGLKGFTDVLLKNHLSLYQGYVNNTNKIIQAMSAALKAENTVEFSELKRRFGWEFNGMRLHELYFASMSKDEKKTKLYKHAAFFKKLVEDYGNHEAWEKEFKTLGMTRGIGWVVLYYDHASKRLFNVWVDEHDTGHLVGCTPLLVMDVFEHAYMLDYGINRAGYIEAFFEVINWENVNKLYSMLNM